MNYSYDLHIHSCLSPCGDMDMTPNNIVNMALLAGLDIIAVSDHNTARNLPAVLAVAKQAGLTVVPAIEACSAEEVHLLCLFRRLEDALACSDFLYGHLPPIRNKPDVFGEQIILDENDHPVGSLEKLLINALDLGIEPLLKEVRGFGGLVIPAHVDKSAYSILSNLGMIPQEYGFTCIEVKNPETFDTDFTGHIITDSDAHYLADIADPVHHLSLSEKSVAAVIDHLKAPAAPGLF